VLSAPQFQAGSPDPRNFLAGETADDPNEEIAALVLEMRGRFIAYSPSG
jgi:hypothetical protein